MKYISHNLEETEKIAGEFLASITPSSTGARIVGLYGDLGSGKTTFTKALAKLLGVEETVTSPTFVIEKMYKLTGKQFTHVIHIDAYRLEREEELVKLGWREIISQKENLILIEWPEKVAGIMPSHIQIHFKAREAENEREINISQMI